MTAAQLPRSPAARTAPGPPRSAPRGSGACAGRAGSDPGPGASAIPAHPAMEARRWPLWLQSLALFWGRATMGLAQSPTRTPPALACSEFSQKSCDECLKNVSCLWCYTNNTCIDYPVRSILPPSSLCSLSNARWGVCWINFEALIIAMAVVAGLILVSVTVCCCYCCYCRRRSRSRPDEEEEQLARKREERRLQSLQRKHERKLKHDEIRKKYGLLQDSDNPYSRFENE
ncbi:pituitary tumor-transforming gene 1 protein-interacting protein-like [Myiozetetes cayanensis]|uniref:pituitary tumor-transforming gene 1 protein-interacting protein-like n=1 Tax=Myiozetetes cayanensis TaxID=478635 RepID=UPI0021605AC7|nr:pituitary tumor-transforming gene 1 protein-interacting protein-like [Myiozetetes cayanensis]